VYDADREEATIQGSPVARDWDQYGEPEVRVLTLHDLQLEVHRLLAAQVGTAPLRSNVKTGWGASPFASSYANTRAGSLHVSTAPLPGEGAAQTAARIERAIAMAREMARVRTSALLPQYPLEPFFGVEKQPPAAGPPPIRADRSIEWNLAMQEAWVDVPPNEMQFAPMVNLRCKQAMKKRGTSDSRFVLPFLDERD
jgi:hypothetical protein